MTAPDRPGTPPGVPQPVLGISKSQLKRIVEGNRAALGLPPQAEDRPGTPDSRSTPWPCCAHCIDGDGMLPCGNFHDEPCGTGDCGLVTDAELAEWRKGLQL